jgi:hypothetical protein
MRNIADDGINRQLRMLFYLSDFIINISRCTGLPLGRIGMQDNPFRVFILYGVSQAFDDAFGVGTLSPAIMPTTSTTAVCICPRPQAHPQTWDTPP